MQAVQPGELGDGRLVVVHAEVDEDVGEPRVAAVALDDEERRRLLPAAVAAGGLRGGEASISRSASGRPAEATKVVASASTVSSATRMFPCAANSGR